MNDYRRPIARLGVLICCFLYLQSNTKTVASNLYWPHWRGPYANGMATDANPPVTWSAMDNIRWKTTIPGGGHASPIVWGDRIYLSTAVTIGKSGSGSNPDDPDEQDLPAAGLKQSSIIAFTVVAIDRPTGKIVWQRVVREALPHAGMHNTNTWASASPLTDGKRIYAFFGSVGLFCLDRDGDVIWQQDLGDMSTEGDFGEGASPALHEDKIVVNWDHQEDSFITALDKQTGEPIWKTDRDESSTWATPVIVEVNGKAQVLVNGKAQIRSYDITTGALIWHCTGTTLDEDVVSSPVVADGIAYVATGPGTVRAVHLAKATGDITGTEAIVWSHDDDAPYVPSPLIYKGLLYMTRENHASLACFDAATGAQHYTGKRLRGIPSLYASPVAAADRIYVAGRNGTVCVVKAGPVFELIARNKLDDTISASPAIVGSSIYIRGEKYLYCIEKASLD